MIRVLSLFGLAGLFLIISPGLRGRVSGGITGFADFLDKSSPYSYIVAVLGILALFVFSLHRGAQPR